MTEKKKLGNLGEKIARRYLWWHGYRILEKNYLIKEVGEIDIIAYDRKKKEIVFVEVKTRSENSVKYFSPEKAVNFHKKNNIIKTSKIYLKVNKYLDIPYRYDIIEIVDKTVNHIKYAF